MHLLYTLGEAVGLAVLVHAANFLGDERLAKDELVRLTHELERQLVRVKVHAEFG